MRKTVLLSCLVIVITTSKAQDSKFRFGVQASYQSLIEKVEISGGSSSGSEGGFTMGTLLEWSVSEKFRIQPELSFSKNVGVSQIQVPIYMKLYLVSKFHFLAGLQLDFVLDGPHGYKDLGLAIPLGMGVDLGSKFSTNVIYSFGVGGSVR